MSYIYFLLYCDYKKVALLIRVNLSYSYIFIRISHLRFTQFVWNSIHLYIRSAFLIVLCHWNEHKIFQIWLFHSYFFCSFCILRDGIVKNRYKYIQRKTCNVMRGILATVVSYFNVTILFISVNVFTQNFFNVSWQLTRSHGVSTVIK